MELRAFEGRWRIEREIEDMAAGRIGRFTGAAVFSAVPGGLAYAETGTLSLAGAAPMAQVYHWFSDAGCFIADPTRP